MPYDLRKQRGIKNYIAEPPSFLDKRKPDTTVSPEQVALYREEDRNIIFSEGEAFENFSLDFQPSREKRSLFPFFHGTLLSFPELVCEAGVFLLIYLPYSPDRILSALALHNRNDFLSDSCEPSSYRSPAAEEALLSVLYFTDSLFDFDRHIRLRVLVSRVASFVGCRVRNLELPVGVMYFSGKEQVLLTAFLLSFFLFAKANNRVPSGEVEEGEDGLSLRLSIPTRLPKKEEMLFPDGIFSASLLDGIGEKFAIFPLHNRTRVLRAGSTEEIIPLLIEWL